MRRTIAAVVVSLLVGCSGAAPRGGGRLYDASALPSGPVGDSIAYGYAIIVQTHRLMKKYVRADLECADCHIAAGTQPRGGSFVGAYARFPQWNKRAHRVITLQDRVAECFLYSMNGRAPSYSSKAMVAIVSYIAWLSRGTRIGAPQPASDRYVQPLPAREPNIARGAALYLQKCMHCHGVTGEGLSGTYPPLWGARSFNDGAGMAHIDRMAGFVRYNMPHDAPGTLTLDQAYDVAAFVLSHRRPHFQRNALVLAAPLPAKYF
jgi:thiosulfate dehydrogenase